MHFYRLFIKVTFKSLFKDHILALILATFLVKINLGDIIYFLLNIVSFHDPQIKGGSFKK